MLVRPPRFAPLRFALCAVLLAGTPSRARADAATSCEDAGTAAERRHGIPAGLLNAIGRVESGRRDPATGRLAPWPWAINAEGRGKLFDNQADALSGTRALQAGGTASVDVGCFQVNLVHHRGAFPTLEAAFDPETNADYAARFLLGLRDRSGSWNQAVANYHSATPERGEPYRDRVMAAWMPGGDGTVRATLAATTVPIPTVPVPVIRTVSWSPQPGTAMRVWTPSAAGQGASVFVMPGRSPRF